MKIKLNSSNIEISDNTTLKELLQTELNITPEKKGVAVALNETIIPREKWETTYLSENDEILIITAAQGG